MRNIDPEIFRNGLMDSDSIDELFAEFRNLFLKGTTGHTRQFLYTYNFAESVPII